MKTVLFTLLLLVCGQCFAQEKECSRLWLNDPFDSVDVIKRTAEEYLQTQLQMTNNEGSKMMYEMKDQNDLNQLKIWMKQKKSVVGGNVTTIYVTSSFKVTGPAERIDALFNALKNKVGGCISAPTDNSFSFATGKVTVEKQGGDWSKKNIQMETMTITSTK